MIAFSAILIYLYLAIRAMVDAEGVSKNLFIRILGILTPLSVVVSLVYWVFSPGVSGDIVLLSSLTVVGVERLFASIIYRYRLAMDRASLDFIEALAIGGDHDE